MLNEAQCHDVAAILSKMRSVSAVQFHLSEFADRIMVFGEFDNSKHTFKSYMWHPEMECFIEQDAIKTA